MLISSVFIVLVSLCFSLFYSLAVVGFHTHLVNGFGIFFVLLRFCECLCLLEALDYLSYITVFLCCHNMCVLLS